MHPPRRTYQAQAAALARKACALAHQRADAGAIHLDQAAEIHEQPLQPVPVMRCSSRSKISPFSPDVARPCGSTMMMSPSVRVLISSLMFDVHKDDSGCVFCPEIRAGPAAIPPETLYDGEVIPPVQTLGCGDSYMIRRAKAKSFAR